MPVYNKRGILLLPKVIVLNPKDGGIGWGAWDAQARQTWIWENGVKRGTGNCLNEVSFARPSLAFSYFSKFLVCPCTNPQRPTQSPEPYLYKYLILPNLDILFKPLYNLKSDNMS